MDARQYLVFRELVDTIDVTYAEFLREGDRKDRRESRIIFYDSMLRVFSEDPLQDEEIQQELLNLLREKINRAADPYTDWIKKVFIEETLKKR